MIHFASDTIVPVVHPSNPVSDITVEQLKSVFFDGDITDWSQLTNGTKKGKIKVYYTDAKVTGPAAAFNRIIGGAEDKAYVSGANLMTGSGTRSHWNVLVSTVGSDQDAIGYAPLSLVTSDAKAIKANGIAASKKSVKDASYPIVNKNYFITNSDPQGLAKEFINYIMSSDGIKIVEADGYFSIME